jgi:hypothetical protein
MNTKDKRRLWWREHKRKQAADRATAKLESQQFAMLPIPMLRSPAWRVLSASGPRATASLVEYY